MSLGRIAILMVILGGAFWYGRRIPLSGVRKRIVLGARLAAFIALGAALWGAPHRRVQETPRHVIYLVDRSASIDPAQAEWMARRIASLEAVRPPRVERAVIAFGREPQILVPFGREPLMDPGAIHHALERSTINRSQTNLETALLSTLALLPPHHHGSIVLLSDGRETSGNATEILTYLRRAGLEIFPAPPLLSGQIKTVWDQLVIPPVVQRGSPVPVQLVVFGGASTAVPGEVTVALEGITIKQQRVMVRPGWQVFTVPVPTIQRGTMALDVSFRIQAEGVSEHRSAYTEVEGPPQLLLVGDRITALPALAAALKRREIDVAVVQPAELPGVLLDYEAVVLFNLPKSAITPEQADVLHTYVETLGGGLVMVGLGGDLAHEIQTPAPIDALLPVQFEPKGLQQSKRRVCIILLIDRSASMMGPRIAATKRAAVELIKQLSPEDLVGVLAFDTKPYVVVEVQQVGQVGSWLVDKLVKLRSSGGTDVYPALTASANRLDLTDATLKHIILLSDGNTPFHEKAYDALIKSFAEDHITVSTIGVGSVFINTDYLKWLSDSTGGTFYQMRNLDELPRLIARDTEHELGRLPFTEGVFRPTKTPTTDWFTDTTDWPSLRGYLTTTAKPGARVDLTVRGGADDDPLLARWQVGQGRVVSFTSDADIRWSPDWIRWPGFDSTWTQIVRWAMRPRLTEELFVSVDRSRGTPTLVVEGELHDPKGELIGAGGERVPLSLVQMGQWRWEASLDQVPSGWYQLALESHEGAASVFAKRWVQIGTPPASGETVGLPPQESLLRQIAQSTGGAYDVPDGAFLPPTVTAAVTEPVLTWWLPLVILLLLVDIAIRGGTML